MNLSSSTSTSQMNNRVASEVSASSGRELSPLIVRAGSMIDLDDIYSVAVYRRRLALSDDVPEILQKGRTQLEKKIAAGQVIYGVNTGFGGNSNLVINSDQLASHQTNLLTFLSAGVGDRFSDEYVRAAQVLTVLALLQGWSAVRPNIVTTLVLHINAGIVPNVPRYGSVGASGDLIPSSYIARALCGIGRVQFEGQDMNATQALEIARISPVKLMAKEGLALVNGTRMMTGVGILTLRRFRKTFDAAVGTVALAVYALRASHEHYDARIHSAKGHPGQIAVAAALREMLTGRSAAASHAQQNADDVLQLAEGVQEIYSIRCAPQVLGVVPESIDSTRAVLEREAVSANDNPLIDPASGDVLHGGNFMGQHVSRAMDALKIDMALVANHMHAIMALLMDSRFSRGLPSSLSPRLGLCQGMKGLQLSHTSLVAHLRQESAPASVHTIATEQFNQDVVSLGLHAAMGAADMEMKLRYIVAMTLLATCQGIDLRGYSDQLSPAAKALYSGVRKISAVLDEDRPMDSEIRDVAHALEQGDLSALRVDICLGGER
jgi:histidine ammonia-lyase